MLDLLCNKKDFSKYRLEEMKMGGYNAEDINKDKYIAASKELQEMKKYRIPKFHGKGKVELKPEMRNT